MTLSHGIAFQQTLDTLTWSLYAKRVLFRQAKLVVLSGTHTHTQCAVAKSISTLTKHTPESLRIYHCFQVCLMLKVGCQAVDCWQKKYHSRPKDLIFLCVISSPNSNGVCPWSVSGQAASPENMEQLLGSSLAHLGRTRHEGAIIKSNCHMLWIKTKAKRTMPVVSEP